MPLVRNAQTKAFYANRGGAPRYHPLEHATIRACSHDVFSGFVYVARSSKGKVI